MKLKNCPFCGNEKAFEARHCDNRLYKFMIECNNCLCSMGGFKTRKQAREAWNRRVEEKQP